MANTYIAVKSAQTILTHTAMLSECLDKCEAGEAEKVNEFTLHFSRI